MNTVSAVVVFDLRRSQAGLWVAGEVLRLSVGLRCFEASTPRDSSVEGCAVSMLRGRTRLVSVKAPAGISMSSGPQQRLEIIVEEDIWEKSGEGVLEGDAVVDDL